MKTTYTTGQVSKICRVAASTVNKWFDSGRLKGYRVPGSRHRRIPRESLIEFLRVHNVPLEILSETAVAKVLIVGRDQHVIGCLKNALSEEQGFRFEVATSGFEAGLRAETQTPACLIVDFGIGQFEALQICRNWRRRRRLAGAVIVALLPSDRKLSPLEHVLVDDVFVKPFDAALLVQRVHSLLSRAS